VGNVDHRCHTNERKMSGAIMTYSRCYIHMPLY
jgi:hypothetical protein